MSSLRRQEPVGAGLRRVACAELESAIRLLTREQGQARAARDAVLRVRAIQALVEPALPRPSVRRDRAVLDRLMAGLAELVDPADITDRLDTHYKKPPDDADLAQAIKAIRKRGIARRGAGQTMNGRAGSFNPVIYRLVADMAELRGHVGEWGLDAMPQDTPPLGLRRSYTRVRRLAGEPLTHASLAEIGALVSQLAEQLGVLNKCCPAMLKPQRKLLARAAESLQDLDTDHALAQALRKQLRKPKGYQLPGDDALAQAADILGEQLTPALAETPGAFSNRLRVYWSAWRG